MVESMTLLCNGCGNGTIANSQAIDNGDTRTLADGTGHGGESSTNNEDLHDDNQNSSKLVYFFTTSKQRTNLNNERPRSMMAVGNSSTWNALSSLRKMGSFKKLKSSVLQGIQAKENANIISDNETDVQKCKPSRMPLSKSMQDGYNLADGLQSDGSDAEETDNAFLRSTHRSRSIRRAYGSGRINLSDTDKASSSQSPLRPLSPVRQEHSNCEIIVKDLKGSQVIYRRSKSTDNLNFLKKSSFKRKSTSNLTDIKSNSEKEIVQKAPLSTPDSDRMDTTPERRSKRWRSPIRAKDFDRVLKIMSNVTDGHWKREGSRCTSPAPEESHRSRPNSRLHDDYSRRVSSSADTERRKSAISAPSPVPLVVCRLSYTDSNMDYPDSETQVKSAESRQCSGSLCTEPSNKSDTSSSLNQLDNEVFYADGEEPKPHTPSATGTPVRPTAPKPQSPSMELYKSAISIHCQNHSTLSLSSMESDERTEPTAPKVERSPPSFKDSTKPSYYDDGNEDSGISSHSQLSLNAVSEEKQEEVRIREGPD